MNPLLKSREVPYYLSNTGAKALFGTPGFAEAANAVPTRPAPSAGLSTTPIWPADRRPPRPGRAGGTGR